MHGRKIQIAAIVLIGSLLFIAPFCSQPKSKNDSIEYINHHDSVQYVGMQTCAGCHFDKQQTFIHTGMGQSFGTASREKSAADFNSSHLLYDSVLGYYYQPFWSGKLLFIKEFRLEGNDTVHQRIERVQFIIGSGQHTNSHLLQKGDYVVQAPFTWYAQKAKLDFPPGFENGNNSRFSRIIDMECMGCHNSIPVMKTGNRDFSQVGNGIDCERCHGPGSAHVNFRRAGGSPTGVQDMTIVNPGKLSWERQIDVCQRCHLQGNNVLKPGKTFNDFRPGMVLSDVFEVYLPQYKGGETSFNMANHADRLQHSKCFLYSQNNASNQKLTCVTCHNPHVSVRSTTTAHFDAQCQKCHSNPKDVKCSEIEAIRQAKNNQCVSCHMPMSGTKDIPHVTVHDHKIGIYKDGIANTKGEVVGLYCVNNSNPEVHTQITAYLTYFEKFDPLPIYQKKASDLLKKHPDFELTIHLYYQQQKWLEIIEMAAAKPDLAKKAASCYRIGKAYHQLARYTLAADWLALAILRDGQFFEYKSELSATYIKLKQYDQAIKWASAALQQFPEYVPALNNLGFAQLMLGSTAEAKQSLLKAVQLDPRNIPAMENLVLLYDRQNNIPASRLWLSKILSVNPAHAQAKKRISTM